MVENKSVSIMLVLYCKCCTECLYSDSNRDIQAFIDKSSSGYLPMLNNGMPMTSATANKDTRVPTADISLRFNAFASIICSCSSDRLCNVLWSTSPLTTDMHFIRRVSRPTLAATLAARAVLTTMASAPPSPATILPSMPRKKEISKIMDTVPTKSIMKTGDFRYNSCSQKHRNKISPQKMQPASTNNASWMRIPGSSGTSNSKNKMAANKAITNATTLTPL
mmetsp:Transcript_21313/g.48991  ORF Transcript_21313/g.48991 Transcript_21313/m.48991 type:complete len:222 (-) Transcript_21313:448-1113(-)